MTNMTHQPNKQFNTYKERPDLHTVDKIAKMLDVNLKELLNDTEKDK